MFRHRAYLTFPGSVFFVTFNGEAGKLDDQQEWGITIEPSTTGAPTRITSTLSGAKQIIQESLATHCENGEGIWKCIGIQQGDNGRNASLAPAAAIWRLIEQWGCDLARQQLKDNCVPQVVALCGGLENALKLLNDLQGCKPSAT